MTDDSTPHENAETAPQAVPTLREYAVEVTRERLERMMAQAEGVRQNEEIESVHQMRVWSRRSRAALEVFEALFAGKTFQTLEREVRSVTGALGEARDLDVMAETLQERAEALPPAQRPGLEEYIGELLRQRQKGQKIVEKALQRLERHDPVALFEQAAGQARRDGDGRKSHG